MDHITTIMIVVFILSLAGIGGFFAWRYYEERSSRRAIRAWLKSMDHNIIRSTRKGVRIALRGVTGLARGMFVHLPNVLVSLVVTSGNLPQHVNDRLDSRRFRRSRHRSDSTITANTSRYIQAIIDHKRHLSEERNRDRYIETE